MVETQAVKFVSVTPPAAIVDNTSFTTASIDTIGWDYLDIYVYFGATDIAMAALKLQTADADTGYADIAGGDFEVSGALPSATADGTCVAWHVNLVGKKRWFDVVATAGDGTAGTYATIFAILSRGGQAPGSATARGLGQELFL